jgi:hypothetical protein
MKTTEYFEMVRVRRDRASIRESWITQVVARPQYERKQADGRIRRWARIEEVHNAFFDRGFEP